VIAALGGRYAVDEEIARDAQRVIYRARATGERGRDRALELSVVDPERVRTLDAPRIVTRLTRMGRISHPWLTVPIDAGIDDGVLWFVTPAISGEPLRARLDRDGSLPLDEARRHARAAAQALQFAHEEKLVHGALSPDTLYLTRDGGITMRDVGIASLLGGSDAASALADQQQLAVCVFAMLTGTLPAASDTSYGSSGARETPSVRALRPEVPDYVDHAVQRALSADPSQRFPCPADFALALRTPAESAPRRLSTTTKLIGAIAILIVLAVSGVGLWMVMRVAADGNRPVPASTDSPGSAPR